MAVETVAQEVLLDECQRELTRIDEEARRLAENLTDEQLHWAPPGGGWSIARVFDHLALSNGSYLEGVRSAIARERVSGAPRKNETWKPSFAGGLLIRSLDPSSQRRLPSPGIWRPTGRPAPGALARFLQTQAAIADLVRDARGIDLTRARLSSPASRFIRLNVGDVFRVFVVHDWRHLGQLRRILAEPGFPAPVER